MCASVHMWCVCAYVCVCGSNNCSWGAYNQVLFLAFIRRVQNILCKKLRNFNLELGRLLIVEESHGKHALPQGIHGLTDACACNSPRYSIEINAYSLSVPGCQHICRKDYLQPQCCPGHWGPDCMGKWHHLRILKLASPVHGNMTGRKASDRRMCIWFRDM